MTRDRARKHPAVLGERGSSEVGAPIATRFPHIQAIEEFVDPPTLMAAASKGVREKAPLSVSDRPTTKP